MEQRFKLSIINQNLVMQNKNPIPEKWKYREATRLFGSKFFSVWNNQFRSPCP